MNKSVEEDDCVFLDMTNEDLNDIIAITKENMGSIIKVVWGVDWDCDFEEKFTLNLRSYGIVKTIFCRSVIIGYFWFRRRDYENDLFINSIQLRSDYQRRGIGVKVLKWMENIALTGNIKGLSLAVQETNTRAVDIYTKYGFQEMTREKGSVFMHKELF